MPSLCLRLHDRPDKGRVSRSIGKLAVRCIFSGLKYIIDSVPFTAVMRLRLQEKRFEPQAFHRGDRERQFSGWAWVSPVTPPSAVVTFARFTVLLHTPKYRRPPTNKSQRTMSEGSAKDVRRIFLPETAFLPKMCAIYGGSANKKANQNFFHLITNVLPRILRAVSSTDGMYHGFLKIQI